MTTKWGVASAGKICHDFVTAVRSIKEEGHEFIAVAAARGLEPAKEFAKLHKIPQAYGSYEALAKDPNVEVVYIGNLMSQHFDTAKLMLENGKHVLVEKSMTLNLKQTQALIDLARQKKRFLMEAVWTRFFPAIKHMTELIEKGTIGDIIHVNINFGHHILELERLIKKHMGGGSVLDLGIYTINAVTMAFKGEKPQKIAAVGHLNEEGVDIATSCSLSYSNNRTASMATSILAPMSNELTITGTKGIIRVPCFWCPTTVVTADKTYEFPLPETIRPCNFTNSSGLRYEAIEVRECIKKGALESATLPLKDSATMAGIMDEIRRQIGVTYDADC